MRVESLYRPQALTHTGRLTRAHTQDSPGQWSRAATSPCTGVTGLLGWKKQTGLSEACRLAKLEVQENSNSKNPLLEVGLVLSQAWTQTLLQRSLSFFKDDIAWKQNLRCEEKQAKPPKTIILSVRHPGAKRHNITNVPPWRSRMMSQPSTIHQRESRQFPLKASKNQLAFKKGRKNKEKGAGGRGGGVGWREITAFQKRASLFHPQFPPQPKCKEHQNT